MWHIHDEVYEYFTYGLPHFSPASTPGADAHTISLFSLSKAYGFASWRIGYMTVPETLWMAVNKIQDTLLICPPHVSQAAAVGALAAGRAYCDRHVAHAGRRAPARAGATREIGDLAEAPSADGAFYCLVRVKTAMLDSMTLAERLIREHQVATVPDAPSGWPTGCYLRVSYGALAPETVDEGMGAAGAAACKRLVGRRVDGLGRSIGWSGCVGPNFSSASRVREDRNEARWW